MNLVILHIFTYFGVYKYFAFSYLYNFYFYLNHLLNLTITESLVIVENAENKLNEVQGESEVSIKIKLYLLVKNLVYNKLKLLEIIFWITMKKHLN